MLLNILLTLYLNLWLLWSGVIIPARDLHESNTSSINPPSLLQYVASLLYSSVVGGECAIHRVKTPPVTQLLLQIPWTSAPHDDNKHHNSTLYSHCSFHQYPASSATMYSSRLLGTCSIQRLQLLLPGHIPTSPLFPVMSTSLRTAFRSYHVLVLVRQRQNKPHTSSRKIKITPWYLYLYRTNFIFLGSRPFNLKITDWFIFIELLFRE